MMCGESFHFSLAEHIGKLIILSRDISEIRGIQFGHGVCKNSFDKESWNDCEPGSWQACR